MRQAAFILLWIFVFAIPFESVIYVPGLGTIGKAAGAGAFMVGIFAIMNSGATARFTSFHAMTVCFIAWGFLGYWWSADTAMTLKRMDTYVQLALMVWLVGEIAPQERQRQRLMQAYLAGVTVLLMFLYRSFSSGMGINAARFSAFDFDANWVAFAISLSIPMIWYLALQARDSLLFWVYMAYIPLVCFAILITASRTGFLCMVVGLSFMPLSYKLLSRQRIALISGAIVLALGVVLAYVPQASMDRIFVKTQDDIEAGLGGVKVTRLWIWEKGLRAFMERPITGVGAGAYRAGSYTNLANTTGPELAPHSSYVGILVEQGIVGFLLFMSLLLIMLRSTRFMEPLERRFFTILLLTCMCGFLFLAHEYKKHTWFVFSLLATHAAMSKAAYERRMAVPPAEEHALSYEEA